MANPDQMNPSRLRGVFVVFGASCFIGAAAILDWALKLKSPLWGLSELLVLAVILVWRRYYLKRIA